MLSLTTPPSSSLSHPISPPPNLHFSTPFELQQLHAQCLKLSLAFPPPLLPRAASVCSLSSSPYIFSYCLSFLHHYSSNPTFVFNSLLRSLAPRACLSLFLRLHNEGLPFDAFTFCFVIKSISDLKDAVLGRAVHGLVEKHGLRSNVFVSNTLLQLYATNGRLDIAMELFDKMPVRDVVSWNTMIVPLSKLGDMETARQLFDQMPEKSVRSWTAVIAGYVQCKNPTEAIKIYLDMAGAPDMNPNEVTIVALLAACADLGNLNLGEKLHQCTIKYGFQNNERICNTLIDLYIKCGCIDFAQKVFDEMPDDLKTIVSWSSLICGHAMHDQGEKALHLYTKMIHKGYKPNGVTFVGLLHTCSNMGLIAKGREYFSSMIKDYKINPKIEHYGCMVDLLSRAGLLNEALEFIKNMPIEPNIIVWGALFTGAKLHKNIEIGELAIKNITKLDPVNVGNYVLGAKNTNGWSRISVDGIIHEFFANEREHPEIKEINKNWEKILIKMRNRGYIPDTSNMLNIEEREKERVLLRHSEKLAVVFGIMRTNPRTVIRVMKNLRVCNDCHVAIKLISDISGREIIVTDRSRFHCFKDGVCSCKDCW